MKFVKQKTAGVLGIALVAMSIGSVWADTDTQVKRVGNVRWVKEVGHDINNQIPTDKANAVFLRMQDADALQSSANVSINDRFQVSLQPGNYSEVLTCVGVNRIGVEITGQKTNDLLLNAADYPLNGGESYYFLVDVNQHGAASISKLQPEKAREILKNMRRQNHQISRVVPNCAAPAEKLSIRLEVLFDTDKSIVKQQYFSEIERVAHYLNRFPDTVVTLEGHTDSRADDNYNEGLSLRRVQAVKQVLVQKYGINAERISTEGFGERKPIATNDTVEGRRLNRRVIAVFETAIQPVNQNFQ